MKAEACLAWAEIRIKRADGVREFSTGRRQTLPYWIGHTFLPDFPLGIHRQRRLVGKVLLLFSLSFPPSEVRYARCRAALYDRNGLGLLSRVSGQLVQMSLY